MRNFYYLCTLLLIMIISSCKTATKVVEIPVETIKKEYINSIKIQKSKLKLKKILLFFSLSKYTKIYFKNQVLISKKEIFISFIMRLDIFLEQFLFI